MQKLSLCLAFVICATVLASCETAATHGWGLYELSAYPPIYHDPRRTGEIKSIAILTPYFPKAPSLSKGNSGGSNLAAGCGSGLGGVSCAGAALIIGTAIVLTAVAAQEASRPPLEDRLEALGLDGGSTQDTLLGWLREDIKARGYVSKPYALARSDGAFLESYPSDLNATALLDLVVDQYGFIADECAIEKRKFAYRPWLNARVRLLRAGDSAVMMRRTITVSPACLGRRGGVYVELDPKHNFADFDSLEADPDLVRDGLSEAIHQLSGAIAGLLAPLNQLPSS